MNKFLISIAFLFVTATAVFAQEEKTASVKENDCEQPVKKDYVPHRGGKFAVSGLVGYNGYFSVAAPETNTSHKLQSSYKSWVNSGLYVGVEGGYFLNDLVKFTLELGVNHAYSPQHNDVPATGTGVGATPHLMHVSGVSTTTYRVVAGANKYFALKKTPKVMPYIGGSLGFMHGISALKEPIPASKGMSFGEAFTFSANAVAGVEYHVTPELYFGIQANPLAFNLHVSAIKPEPGVLPIKSDTFEFSFLSAPSIRLGLVF